MTDDVEKYKVLLAKILVGVFVLYIGLSMVGYFMGSFAEVMLNYSGWDKLIVGFVIAVCIASPFVYLYKTVIKKSD